MALCGVQGELGPWSEPEEVISRLIHMLKASKLQQGADSQQASQGPRVMTTDELSELSYEQLIEMQDNLNMVSGTVTHAVDWGSSATRIRGV